MIPRWTEFASFSPRIARPGRRQAGARAPDVFQAVCDNSHSGSFCLAFDWESADGPRKTPGVSCRNGLEGPGPSEARAASHKRLLVSFSLAYTTEPITVHSLALQRYFLSSTLAIFGRMAKRTGSAPPRMSLSISRLGLAALQAPPFPPLCVTRPPIGLTHNGRFGDPDGSGAVFCILARRMSPYIVHPQGLTMRARPEVAL